MAIVRGAFAYRRVQDPGSAAVRSRLELAAGGAEAEQLDRGPTSVVSLGGHLRCPPFHRASLHLDAGPRAPCGRSGDGGERRCGTGGTGSRCSRRGSCRRCRPRSAPAGAGRRWSGRPARLIPELGVDLLGTGESGSRSSTTASASACRVPRTRVRGPAGLSRPGWSHLHGSSHRGMLRSMRPGSRRQLVTGEDGGMADRLRQATSPYSSTRTNAVDWWPWSDGAFAEARRRGVPVMLSSVLGLSLVPRHGA